MFSFSPHHQFIRLLQIFRGNSSVELPGDVHRAGTVVLDVTRCAEESVGRRAAVEMVGFEFADEEGNTGAFLFVADVALAGRRGVGSGALALPVEECVAYRVVVVHRGGGVVFFAFVEGDEEDVEVLFGQPLDAFANGGGFVEVECKEDLVARVGAVEVEGAVEAEVDGRIDEIDLVVVVGE